MTLFWKSHGLCFESAIFSETPKKRVSIIPWVLVSRGTYWWWRGLARADWSRNGIPGEIPPTRRGKSWASCTKKGPFFFSSNGAYTETCYNSNWLLMAKPWIHGPIFSFTRGAIHGFVTKFYVILHPIFSGDACFLDLGTLFFRKGRSQSPRLDGWGKDKYKKF